MALARCASECTTNASKLVTLLGGFGGLAPGGNGLGGGSGGGARGSGGGVGDGGGGERSHPFSVPQEAHPSNSHCRAHGGDEVRHMNDLERHGLICCLVGFPWGTYRILAAPARTRGWWRRSCAEPVACRSAGRRGRGLRWRRRSRWRGNGWSMPADKLRFGRRVVAVCSCLWPICGALVVNPRRHVNLGEG